MLKTPAYAAEKAGRPTHPFSIERREPGPHEVLVDILYCGICHSDVHQVRDQWGGSIFPMVPGHEIVGRVVKTGDEVKKWQAGDTVGIGCFVESCRTCEACQSGEEQFCEEGMSPTYNSYERDRKTRLRWLLHPHHRQRRLRTAHSVEPGAGRGGTAPLRRHHDLFPPAPLRCQGRG